MSIRNWCASPRRYRRCPRHYGCSPIPICGEWRAFGPSSITWLLGWRTGATCWRGAESGNPRPRVQDPALPSQCGKMANLSSEGHAPMTLKTAPLRRSARTQPLQSLEGFDGAELTRPLIPSACFFQVRLYAADHVPTTELVGIVGHGEREGSRTPVELGCLLVKEARRSHVAVGEALVSPSHQGHGPLAIFRADVR